MKNPLLLAGCCMLMISFSSCAQKSANLDGKSFTIEVFDVNVPDQKDDDVIHFDGGKITSDGCDEWGFNSSEYSAEKEKDKTHFEATCSSDTEGKIIWKGTVDGNKIEGTYLWQKDGQGDITYSFSGEEN